MALPPGAPTLNVLSLFTGIGGLDRGLELGLGCLGIRARVVCAVEGEPFNAGVLAQEIEEQGMAPFPVWSDVNTFDGRPWAGCIDLVAGGFPCQDISPAGLRRGIEGERSGLFFELMRVVREVRPRFVFLENVSALLVRGVDRVLGALAAAGFDAEWGVFSARDIGAPHKRDRWFCLAYASDQPARAEQEQQPDQPGQPGSSLEALADAVWLLRNGGEGREEGGRRGVREDGQALVDAEDIGRERAAGARREARSRAQHRGDGAGVADASSSRPQGAERAAEPSRPATQLREVLVADGHEDRRQGLKAGDGADGEVAERGGDDPDGRGARLRGRLPDPDQEPLRQEQGRHELGGPEETVARARREPWPTPFPPGPRELDLWARIIAERPELAPAQPNVCGVADGLSVRADRLRSLGNAVVPEQAARAFLELWLRLWLYLAS